MLLSLPKLDAMMAIVFVSLVLAAAPFTSAKTMQKPTLSGDGHTVFFVAEDGAGQEQLFGQPLGNRELLIEGTIKQLTQFISGRITKVMRTGDTLYLERAASEGRSEVHAVDAQGTEVRNLTVRFSGKASLLAVNALRRDELLLTVKREEAGLADVWRMNPVQPSGIIDTVNPGDVVEWRADATLVVRGAVARLRNGGTEIRVRRVAGEPFRALVTASVHETLALHGFSADGRSVFLTTSVSGRVSRVVEKNIATGAERVLAQWPQHDVELVQQDNVKSTVEAVSFQLPTERKWVVVGRVRADFEALGKQLSDGFSVVSRDQNDTQWIVATESMTESPRLYRWTRSLQKLEPLESGNVGQKRPAAPRPTLVASLDDAKVQGALIEPQHKKAAALVVLVEGGPVEGPVGRFSPTAAALVAQGFAVLRVELPATAGRGKRRLGVDVLGVATADALAQLAKVAASQAQLSTGALGVIGEHLSGSVALLMAARHAEALRCLAVRDAPLNYLSPELAERQDEKSLSWRWAQLFENLEQPETLAQWTAASPLWVAHQLRGPILVAVTESQNWTNPPDVAQLSAATRGPASRLMLTSSAEFADRMVPHFVACFKDAQNR